MNKNLVSIRVWGDFACFTRPEMKVERVSYPVMTPSAARGVLEAIFWEPEMYYLIDSIRIVKRGRWISFRRNEVTRVIKLDRVRTWMRSPQEVKVIQADDPGSDEPPKRESTRAQRNMLALADVEYIITAEVRLTKLGESAPEEVSKYLHEIERRARIGKCFHRPALGVREFAADFEWEDDAQAALERRAGESNKDWRRIWAEEDLGLMLYDVFDHNQRSHGFRVLGKDERMATPEREGVPVKPEAVFFHARVANSRLDCHPQQVRFVQTKVLEV